MRLWHKDFIHVLPKEQLTGLWRELSVIAGAIQKNGTPNHILVNFILHYDYSHFINYAKLIRDEMTRRGYRTMNSVWDKITNLKPDWDYLSYDEIYKEKMDNTYLDICFYNLYEKILCEGGIKEPDSSNIINLYHKKRKNYYERC